MDQILKAHPRLTRGAVHVTEEMPLSSDEDVLEPPPAGLTDVVQIAAGDSHALAPQGGQHHRRLSSDEDVQATPPDPLVALVP
jgi:hypothetical protein